MVNCLNYYKARIAQEILTPEADYTDPYMDFSIKFVALFLWELQQIASTGFCPIRLFVWLLVLRSQMPADTQDVEGMNSVLQWMTKCAPTLRQPMVSPSIYQQRNVVYGFVWNCNLVSEFVSPKSQSRFPAIEISNAHIRRWATQCVWRRFFPEVKCDRP